MHMAANKTWKYVQAKSKQAIKQVSLLGIRDEKARMAAGGGTHYAVGEDDIDMRWNPNDDGILLFPTL